MSWELLVSAHPGQARNDQVLYERGADLSLHPAKLELLLRDYEQARARPALLTALSPLGVGAAFLVGLVSGETKDIGLSAADWEAFLLWGAVIFLAVGVVQTVRVLFKLGVKRITARDLVHQVIADMSPDEDSDALPAGE